MDDSEEDQRKPHRQTPNVPAAIEELHKVGVISWKLDADDPENDPALAAIRKVRRCPRPSNPWQHQMCHGPKLDPQSTLIILFLCCVGVDLAVRCGEVDTSAWAVLVCSSRMFLDVFGTYHQPEHQNWHEYQSWSMVLIIAMLLARGLHRNAESRWHVSSQLCTLLAVYECRKRADNIFAFIPAHRKCSARHWTVKLSHHYCVRIVGESLVVHPA